MKCRRTSPNDLKMPGALQDKENAISHRCSEYNWQCPMFFLNLILMEQLFSIIDFCPHFQNRNRPFAIQVSRHRSIMEADL